ncbi:MAG: hypothetical protein K6B75_08030 [Lachnospiraceae bacterium]|nr:hypothetical protein [Lachnospiraceae bacterium]
MVIIQLLVFPFELKQANLQAEVEKKLKGEVISFCNDVLEEGLITEEELRMLNGKLAIAGKRVSFKYGYYEFSTDGEKYLYEIPESLLYSEIVRKGSFALRKDSCLELYLADDTGKEESFVCGRYLN